ncbi:hypothetical protein FXO37_04107 [Capsicum annuum]|nr:hypothetical protein FXO37_04107 [Capsicum annuum]
MKEIRKVVAEKLKKTVGKSSILSKKDDFGRPRLPKVVGIKVKYEKFMVDYFDKRPVVDVQSQVNLDIQGFEEFNTVPPTEILKMAGLITDASTSHQTKKRKIVRFDSTTAEEKVCQKTPSFVSTRTVPTQKNNFFRFGACSCRKDCSIIVTQDVAGCSKDNATANLDTLVESVVNHNSDNTNVRTSITVHIHNDHMVDCSSTLPESIQLKLDAILKVIAAPVDDVPIEVIPPAESVVNQHDISDSQLPFDFPDTVVAAHQAAKTPTKISKRTRMRSKVFESPYKTEYASGSKAIEDQIEEQKQQFVFDGFLISDTMLSSVIEEFKQWVKEGLLKFHAKK